MRIGIFTECYRPIMNGVVVSIETFRRELLAQGHDVWLFTPDYQPYADPTIIPLRSVGLPSRTPYRCATPFLVRERPPALDIIHAHSPFSTGVLALYQARHYRCPLVFTYHTRLEDYVHYVPLPTSLARRSMRWASRTYCNWTDMVITPTQEIQKLLLGYGVRVPVEVLPTAISLEGVDGADVHYLRARYSLSAQTQVLLTVGRLAPEKNLPFLLEAFAHIHTAHPRTVLVIVGDGPDKATLEAQVARLGLADAVHFAGLVDRSQIAHYYASADLFVFASLTETQGLVLGEALQAGTPVVAVAAGGVIDALRGVPGSITCPPRVDQFAATVDALLRDPAQLQGMRDSAGHGSPGMDPSKTVEMLLGLYRQVLTGDRRPERALVGAVSSHSDR